MMVEKREEIVRKGEIRRYPSNLGASLLNKRDFHIGMFIGSREESMAFEH